MLKKNSYKTQNHPVSGNMPQGNNQVGRLMGKLNVAMEKKDEIPATPIEPIVEYLVLDGNVNIDEVDNNIFDGNINI